MRPVSGIEDDLLRVACRYRLDHDLELAVIEGTAGGVLHLDQPFAQALAIHLRCAVMAHRVVAGTAHQRMRGPGAAGHARELRLPETVPLLSFETREEMRRYRIAPPPFIRGADLEEIILSPGDFLYLPRGYIHDVHAIGTFTVHLTFGIQQITWIDFIGALAATAGLRDPRLRRSIPVRHHRSEPRAMQLAVDEALAAFIESAYAAAFRFIAASSSLAAHELPGSLPPGEQLATARRLVRERLYLMPPRMF